MNMYEIVGASMGLHRDDHYKRLKIMQDADAILPIAAISCKSTGSTSRRRALAIQGMLDEQPAPLRGA